MPLAPAPAVARAALLLRHLADHPAQRFTVSELARRLSVPRATCDTLLLALTDAGLVRRDAERRYQLGPGCIALGDAARTANSTLRAAATHAEALAREVGGFTLVAIRDGDETRVADVFDFAPALGLRARVAEAIPLVPPFGASFVAWGDDDEVMTWLARADPPLDAGEEATYRGALRVVRERGYSVTVVTARQTTLIHALERLVDDRDRVDARAARDEAVRQMTHSEHLTGDLDPSAPLRIAQVSAPVLDADGRAGAAIMLLGPNHELTAEEVADLGQRVARAAARAAADAGGRASA